MSLIKTSCSRTGGAARGWRGGAGCRAAGCARGTRSVTAHAALATCHVTRRFFYIFVVFFFFNATVFYSFDFVTFLVLSFNALAWLNFFFQFLFNTTPINFRFFGHSLIICFRSLEFILVC